MSMMSKPYAIAMPGTPGTPVENNAEVQRMKREHDGKIYDGLVLAGHPVKWRNYEYVNGRIHSVWEII